MSALQTNQLQTLGQITSKIQLGIKVFPNLGPRTHNFSSITVKVLMLWNLSVNLINEIL